MRFPCLVFSFLMFIVPSSRAQLCTGSLGDPIINVTFGTVPQKLPAGVTTYDFVGGCPGKGQYTMGNLILGCGETPGAHSWFLQAGDHTRDLNGQFMLVNAESTPGTIHLDTVNNLCGNTHYQYSAWITNVMEKVLACGGNPVLPNIVFTVSTFSGQVIASGTTGDIPLEDSRVWRQYGITFTTPADINSVVLTLSTHPPYGCGSAFAVDDITFSICGPSVSAAIDGSPGPAGVCADYTNPFILSGTYSPGFNDPAVQWQSSADTGKTWLNIEGAVTTSYHIPRRPVGVILYRMLVAESANINSVNCLVASNSIYTEVHPVPLHDAPQNIIGCINKNLLLPASDPKALSITWLGPNGYTSTNPAAVVTNITYADTGIYSLKQSFYFGCTSIDTFNLKVFPSTTIETQTLYSVCEGTPVHLSATGDGTFEWTPSKGLSNDAIPNPVATPADSIIYKVIVTNSFGCKDSADVAINVFKNPGANAGADKEIMAGDTIQLNGTVSGTHIKFYWTPATFISNTNIADPLVSPVMDTRYTLTTVSNVGCGIATSGVDVKVFKDIYIPNAFSPNGDGLNDNFKVIAPNSYLVKKLLIYNRYGELLFNQRSVDVGWDGSYKGMPQPQGAYIYYVELLSLTHKRIVRKGEIFLLR